uniref:Uncharacterized protein n=1 Tax=Sander lucioperca TaxID=283035 RepID=A0A8C9XQU3_SANLU
MGAEGTKMDDDFLKMEKVLQSLLVELLSRTTEFLQPHPGKNELNPTLALRAPRWSP